MHNNDKKNYEQYDKILKQKQDQTYNKHQNNTDSNKKILLKHKNYRKKLSQNKKDSSSDKEQYIVPKPTKIQPLYYRAESKDSSTYQKSRISQNISTKIFENNEWKQPKPFQGTQKTVVTIKSRQTQIQNDSTQLKMNYKFPQESSFVKNNKPPISEGSKNNFRIKKKEANNINSKKLKQQLIQINEKQQQLQKQILFLHSSNKQFLKKIKNKYSLNFNSQITSPTTNIDVKYKQIDEINIKLMKNEKQLENINNKINNNHYIVYLQTTQNIFEISQDHQSFDQVQQLAKKDQNNSKIIQPRQNNLLQKTYCSLMPEIKHKKWGLHQRISYETQIQTNQILNSQVKNSNNSMHKILEEQIQNQSQIHNNSKIENKITINPKLKNILLQ